LLNVLKRAIFKETFDRRDFSFDLSKRINQKVLFYIQGRIVSYSMYAWILGSNKDGSLESKTG